MSLMWRLVSLAMLLVVACLVTPRAGLAAEGHIEFFAPARVATSAIQEARRAGAAELAPDELRLADQYNDEAVAALDPASGPPDVRKATHLFRMAAAEARLAETRAIEVVSDRKAADGGSRFLRALDGPSMGTPMGPSPTPEAMAEYARLRREAAKARAAHRAAEETVERLGSEGS